MSVRKPRILLGVTADMSLRLMRGFPQYLVENGWDVHVVSSPGPALDEIARCSGITAHSLKMTRDISPIADLRSLIAWISLLRVVRPDLMSVGTPKAGLLGGIAGWLTHVPDRVYMLRGLRMETTSGMKRTILAGSERIAIASAHRVLAVSKSLMNRTMELGLVDSRKISVLGQGSSNGVDLAEFDRANFSEIALQNLKESLGLVPDVSVVGFVGRLTADKGLHVLAQARGMLAKDGVDYQLLIVGGVDDESGQSSLDRLRNSGRPVIETGHVANPAIYYQLMDLLCLPTFREGFPNVVLEACAARLPTITTTATGAVDAVIDGQTGLLISVGDAAALAAAMTLLLKDDHARRRMGHAAHVRAERDFARPIVWRNLLDSFERSLVVAPLWTT